MPTPAAKRTAIMVTVGTWRTSGQRHRRIPLGKGVARDVSIARCALPGRG